MTNDLLPSWREGATRSAIIDFLDVVEEIPPTDRVAVFDNDGTMWCERPVYIQLDFMIRELQHAVESDPSLADRPEYRALLGQNREEIDEMGLERIALALVELHSGLSPAQYESRVRDFFATVRHRDLDVHYRGVRYQPMLELMDELRARGFDFYLVTGGGADFVRVIGDEFYAVTPEGVVGSQIEYDLVHHDDGSIDLARTARVVDTGPNEGETKPTNIQRILGRRPTVAGGNSAGDAEMLRYVQSYDGPSLALLVNHDDAEREYAYESVAATFDQEESILDTAGRLGWVVASIRNDWATVFAPS